MDVNVILVNKLIGGDKASPFVSGDGAAANYYNMCSVTSFLNYISITDVRVNQGATRQAEQKRCVVKSF